MILDANWAMPVKSPLFRCASLSLPGRAGMVCHAREPCRRAADTRPPSGEAAPLVSILPRSPAGNYTQIKNVSKSNFSSSQVWAETCDLLLRRRKEPCSSVAAGAPGGKQGAAPRSPTLLHPHPPPLLPQLRAAGPSFSPGSPLHGGISQAPKGSQGRKLLVQRAHSVLQVHSLSMIAVS